MKTIKMLTGIALVAILTLTFSTTSFAQNHGKHCPMHGACHDSGSFFGKNIRIEELGGDSMLIYVSKHTMHDMSDHGFPWKKWHLKKFNGHWAGIDLGFNGYVNKDFNMNLPANARFLDLNTARSLEFTFNPFELNLNLAKNHLGLVSGLGLTINNYFFEDKGFYFVSDEPVINAYRITDRDGVGVSLNKSKMTVVWITLPVLLEYQTNPGMRWNSFHITGGAIVGARVGQYTKQYYPGINTTYYLSDQYGNSVGTFSSDKYKTKDHGQFHLNPFKVDATLRIGWSFLNFWGTYSLTTLFKDKQGPELYPYSVGITLASW